MISTGVGDEWDHSPLLYVLMDFAFALDARWSRRTCTGCRSIVIIGEVVCGIDDEWWRFEVVFGWGGC